MKTETGTFLFKRGMVYQHSSRSFAENDILVENGQIKKIGTIKPDSIQGKVVQVDGMYIVPGLLDMHVHLREPGREDEETIQSGIEAAMEGGFTSVCCMPNTMPAIDNRGVVEFIKKQAHGGLVDVHPIAAVTKNREGNELTEMGDMRDAGAVAFSDDGVPVADTKILRYALEYSRMFGTPIIDHCEDQFLASGKVMNEGIVSTSLGLEAVPTIAEDLIVARDLMMAEFTGGFVHIAHVSSSRAVEMIRDAKKKGIQLTAEACPHHFILTDDAVRKFDTSLRVNPPLRTQKDVDSIIQGLKDGTIDAIASDHAPHSLEEKDVEFDAAPPGMIGLETILGLTLTFLVEKEVLTMEQLVDRMALAPRRILNLPVPLIKEGEVANFSVIDVNKRWEVDKRKFKSKSRNTPFHGWELNGKSFGVFNHSYWYQAE